MELNSIYIGGGTPNCVPSPALAELLQFIRQNLKVLPAAEISIEANPGLATDWQLLAAAGINRVSLGVQAGQDRLLKAMGRCHQAQDAAKMIAEIRAAGISNISVDLIYALPGQSLADWQASLELATSWPVKHISTYGLHLSPETAWGQDLLHAKLKLPDEEINAQMLEQAMAYLPQQGFKQYELANFAVPGFQCRHNLGYWQRHNYLGAGVAAASCVAAKRWQNSSDWQAYLEKAATGAAVFAETLDPKAVLAEAVFLGLRLSQGIVINDFNACYRVDLCQYYAKEIELLLKQDLVKVANGVFSLTERGMLLGNEVFWRFL